MTGTGFTTSESELMLSTKRRRKLTQIMILCSYIFNISIVTTIVNVFISSNNTSITEFIVGLLLTIINIILLLLLNKSTKVRRFFDNIIQNISIRSGEKRPNPISVYDYYNNKVIAEVKIVELNNKINSLNSNILKEEYDIQLLVVKRGNEIITDILPNLSIKDKDVLLVFGNLKKIKSVFKLGKDNRKNGKSK